MGFGFLFVGFLMMLDTGWTVSASPVITFDIFPNILGYLLMLRAMKHLRKSSKDLNIFYYVTCVLCLVGGASFIGQITAIVMRFAHLPGLGVVSDILEICTYAERPLMLVAIIFLTGGIGDLALSLELPKLGRYSKVCMAVSSLVYLALSLSEFGFVRSHLPVWATPLIALLFYVQFAMMLVLIFSCYRQIGFEGEEDIPEKEHPITRFLNKMSLMKAKYSEDDDDEELQVKSKKSNKSSKNKKRR